MAAHGRRWGRSSCFGRWGSKRAMWIARSQGPVHALRWCSGNDLPRGKIFRPRSLAMQKWKRLTCSILFGLAATAAALFGQGNTGSIVGTVTDPSGALIPGVEITITNLQTGVSTPAITDSAGAFAARFIVAGSYKL